MRLIFALLAIALTTSFPVSGGTGAGSFDEIRLRLIDLIDIEPDLYQADLLSGVPFQECEPGFSFSLSDHFRGLEPQPESTALLPPFNPSPADTLLKRANEHPMDPGDDELKQIGPKIPPFEKIHLHDDPSSTLLPYCCDTYPTFSGRYAPPWVTCWGLDDPWGKR